MIDCHSEASGENQVSMPVPRKSVKERYSARHGSSHARRRLKQAETNREARECLNKKKIPTYRCVSQGYVQVVAISGTLDQVCNNIVAEREDERLGRQARVSVRGAVEQQAALWHLEGVHDRVVSRETEQM